MGGATKDRLVSSGGCNPLPYRQGVRFDPPPTKCAVGQVVKNVEVYAQHGVFSSLTPVADRLRAIYQLADGAVTRLTRKRADTTMRDIHILPSVDPWRNNKSEATLCVICRGRRAISKIVQANGLPIYATLSKWLKEGGR
jgi:hypothetical protein